MVIFRPIVHRLLFAFTLFTALTTLANAGERYAVIVGVSEYPSLAKHFWLKGPKNDARLVRDYLISNPATPFKADNIVTLADGVEGAGMPTLAAIRTAMRKTAERAQKGDLVYLHFSGHGTQAPAINAASEIDGLDELFLPRDVSKWNDEVGMVENALVDDEIGTMIGAIRAKGAFVWAVFDSCHSGTVTRGAPLGDDIRMRKLSPNALGISDAALQSASDNAVRSRSIGSSRHEKPLELSRDGAKGGFVAFYAAQTTETTPEMRLPKGKKGRQSQGLFTFTLFQALAENPGISYRRLGQELLRRYGASYLNQPTPLFEGDLDLTALGSKPQKRIPQWLVKMDDDEVLNIPAGSLHGLEQGMRLLLLPKASSPPKDALGEVEITGVETLSSTVEFLAVEGKPSIEPAAFETGLVARRISAPVSFLLKVARPQFTQNISATLKAKTLAILDNLKSADDEGLRLSFVDAGMEADLRLALTAENADERPGHLWLLPSTGELVTSGHSKTPSISLMDKNLEEAASAFRDNLTRIARVANLLKLGGGGQSAEEIEIKLRTKRKGTKRLISLDPASMPALHPGDEVHIVAKNTSNKPIDINVLYIGSDYSISHMYRGRVHPGNTKKKGLLGLNDKSFGVERVLLITTPAKPQTAVEDLRFLAQKAVPTTRGGGFKALLQQAGFGHATRGAVSLADEEEEGASGAIHQFLIEVTPQ